MLLVCRWFVSVEFGWLAVVGRSAFVDRDFSSLLSSLLLSLKDKITPKQNHSKAFQKTNRPKEKNDAIQLNSTIPIQPNQKGKGKGKGKARNVDTRIHHNSNNESTQPARKETTESTLATIPTIPNPSIISIHHSLTPTNPFAIHSDFDFHPIKPFNSNPLSIFHDDASYYEPRCSSSVSVTKKKNNSPSRVDLIRLTSCWTKKRERRETTTMKGKREEKRREEGHNRKYEGNTYAHHSRLIISLVGGVVISML